MAEVDGFRKALKVTSIDAFFQFAVHRYIDVPRLLPPLVTG